MDGAAEDIDSADGEDAAAEELVIANDVASAVDGAAVDVVSTTDDVTAAEVLAI